MPAKKQERIKLPDGREVMRLIRYPKVIRDGTYRCIRCGQIDEDGWHNSDLCLAIGDGTVILDMAKNFVPISDAARDGDRQLVKRGADFAAAMWTGNFWSYPYGKGEGEPCAYQIDFEPTHYWPKPPRDAIP